MIPENSSIQDPSRGQKDWLGLVLFLWSVRKLIILIVGITTVGALVVSFILPDYYRSTATLLPETEKSKLGSFGGLTDLAALAGVSIGADGELAKLYPAIVRSEGVLKDVIYGEYITKRFSRPVDLIMFYDIDEDTPEREFEVLLESLREQLEISTDSKTSVVSISLETEEASISADIINRILFELDEFMRTKRTTTASQQRKWVEARLTEVKTDLESAEDTLKTFREKNRRIVDSPLLLLEQGRLIREYEINAALYMELKKQYEIIKIEEVKNLSIVNIMDEARPAAIKSRPNRSLIVVSAFLLSLFTVTGYFLLENRYGKQLKRFTARIRGSGHSSLSDIE